MALVLACVVFLGGAPLAGAEVLDRVVATIGRVAITRSDVEREYLFERFLDADWPAPPPNAAMLEQVRERLTYQKLLALEEGVNPGEQPEFERLAAEHLANVRRQFPREEDFEAALRTLGINEQRALEQLAEHERVLRIIDQRLRPAAWPGDAEVETYYRDTFAPEYQRRNPGPVPALPEVEHQIREVLGQRRIDQLLTQWLDELKSARRVRFHSF